MNIFIISRGFPTKKEPLRGNFELMQAEALGKLGHNVTLLALDGHIDSITKKPGLRKINEHHGYIYNLFPFFLFRFAPHLKIKAKKLMMRRLINLVSEIEGKPDVIYAHYLANMQMSTDYVRESNCAFVGIEHWSEMMKSDINPKLYKIAQETYPLLDRLITVSPTLQRSILEKFSVDSDYVPNMVADEFIEAPPGRYKKGRFRFCAIGRLVGWKNFDILIKASELLKERGFDFELNIIGSGEEYENLKHLIADMALTKEIRLKGMQPRKEIIRILSESDALVLPSEHETFGVVFIEAMAMGLPVIAGKAGGPLDIIDESTGILVRPGEVEELAEAMQEMIEKYDRYDKEEIAAKCKANYSSGKVAKKIETIFTRVLERKGNLQKTSAASRI